LRILDPSGHAIRRILEKAGNVGPGADPMQRRAHISVCVCNPRNLVTTAASIMPDKVRAAMRIAVEIVGARGLASFASSDRRAQA
jgi:hypothetical protein